MDPIVHTARSHLQGIPVIGICGFSNSGKTTLIEHLVSLSVSKGLYVAVVKHYSRSFLLDAEGKDTHRFFQAGATVLGLDAQQRFTRYPVTGHDREFVLREISRLAEEHDLILIEGQKTMDVPVKVWLQRNEHDTAPSSIQPVRMELGMNDDRISAVQSLVESELIGQFIKRPLFGGIFAGYSDNQNGNTVGREAVSDKIHRAVKSIVPVVQQVFLLGNEQDLAGISGFPKITAGPAQLTFLSAIRYALRCHPHSSWIFTDLSRIHRYPQQITGLLQHTAPGTWCILPEPVDIPHILWIDSRARRLIERSDHLTDVVNHPKTHRVAV